MRQTCLPQMCDDALISYRVSTYTITHTADMWWTKWNCYSENLLRQQPVCDIWSVSRVSANTHTHHTVGEWCNPLTRVFGHTWMMCERDGWMDGGCVGQFICWMLLHICWYVFASMVLWQLGARRRGILSSYMMYIYTRYIKHTPVGLGFFIIIRIGMWLKMNNAVCYGRVGGVEYLKLCLAVGFSVKNQFGPKYDYYLKYYFFHIQKDT